MVAFMQHVATGEDKPCLSLADMGLGMGIAVNVLLEALRWRYLLCATVASPALEGCG